MSTPNIIFNVKYTQTEAAILSKPQVNEEHLKNRLYYGCKQSDDFIKYVDKGIIAGDVVGYTGNQEKSSGVFDQNGKLTRQQRGELREKLRKTDSIIWHTVISFSEDFGKKYMKSDEDAQELLRAELPRFFKRIGMPEDNVIWFAGLHENTDNQHIHLAFFEKEPIYISARDKTKKRYRYGKIPKDAIDSFIIHSEERLMDADFDLKRSRRELTSASNEILSRVSYYDSFDRELKKQLLALYRLIPAEGRVSYNSLNMAGLRPIVRGIVDFIIKNNPAVKECYQRFCTDLVKKDSDVKAMCLRQNISPLPYLVEDKYIEDMYRRLGDKVIQAAFAIKGKEDKALKKCKSHNTKKRVERIHRQYLYDRSFKLTEEVNTEAIDFFEEYRRKLAEANYNRLVEEGIIEAE